MAKHHEEGVSAEEVGPNAFGKRGRIGPEMDGGKGLETTIDEGEGGGDPDSEDSPYDGSHPQSRGEPFCGCDAMAQAFAESGKQGKLGESHGIGVRFCHGDEKRGLKNEKGGNRGQVNDGNQVFWLHGALTILLVCKGAASCWSVSIIRINPREGAKYEIRTFKA
jgi:hypothetical protein